MTQRDATHVFDRLFRGGRGGKETCEGSAMSFQLRRDKVITITARKPSIPSIPSIPRLIGTEGHGEKEDE